MKKTEEYKMKRSDYLKEEIVIYGDDTEVTIIPAESNEISIQSTIKTFANEPGKIVFLRCKNDNLEIKLPKKINDNINNSKLLEIELLGNNINIRTNEGLRFDYSVNLVMLGLDNKLNETKITTADMVTYSLNPSYSNQPNRTNPNKTLTKSNPNI